MQADVYSLGRTAEEVLQGSWEGLPPLLANTIARCKDSNPARRPSAEGVLEALGAALVHVMTGAAGSAEQ